MKLRSYPRYWFSLVPAVGALVAAILCIQCVGTYFYTDAVLVPQQAEREAQRQLGSLTSAARTAGISNPRALSSAMEHILETVPDRVQWLRLFDPEKRVVAQAGSPQGAAHFPQRWRAGIDQHQSPRTVDTPQGKAFILMLPFRLQHPPLFSEAGLGRPTPIPASHAPFMLELAIPASGVTRSFEGLRQNLIVGVVGSIALLISVVVIALRAPCYFRGKYLENELQLARSVQSHLQPKPQSVSPHIQFAASAIAADHIGGDFYDIFEAEPGKFAIVLGDVSGKGVSAALLVSVLQGAIRSSASTEHEKACERISGMLCELTACERFATVFWGVFDSSSRTLRYVNAGHAAPMLVRNGPEGLDCDGVRATDHQAGIIRLEGGGPVLGLLPQALYTAGSVQIEPSDVLVLCSDGITEAANQNEEEFGEARIEQLTTCDPHASPSDLCHRIMHQVSTFASTDLPPDDRTLLVVRFGSADMGLQQENSLDITVGAVA